MAESEIMTLQEVCDYLRLSERTIHRMMEAGRLEGIKVGKRWRFRRADVVRTLDRLEAEQQGEKRGPKPKVTV